MQSPQYPDTAGAVYLSGTEGVRFEECTFKYLAVRTPSTVKTYCHQLLWFDPVPVSCDHAHAT